MSGYREDELPKSVRAWAITGRKRAERALLDQLAVIQAQRDTLQALSSPVIEVWERVLCVPVVRLLDRARAAEMMQSLLAAVVRTSARFAILDLTAVDTIDTLAATHLLKLSAAARLLGAESVITGLSSRSRSTCRQS